VIQNRTHPFAFCFSLFINSGSHHLFGSSRPHLEEFPAFQCQFSAFKTAGPKGDTLESGDIFGGRATLLSFRWYLPSRG